MQRGELGAQLGVGLESPGQAGGDHRGAGLADAALGHAAVLGADQARGAFGLEVGVQRVGDLPGEPFLDLESVRVDVEQARELAAEPGPTTQEDG